MLRRIGNLQDQGQIGCIDNERSLANRMCLPSSNISGSPQHPDSTFIPSANSLQLLRNLGVIRDSLQRLGKLDVIRQLDKYIDYLQTQCASDLEFIDCATAAIHWVYQVLTPGERRRAFCEYRMIDRHGLQHGCGPKAEVEHFCQKIEPKILAVCRQDNSSAR